MLLYHGTTEKIARLALDEGLLPRDEADVETRWPDCPSRGDMVYLTRAYAPYFAMSATENGDRWGLVEIDTELYPEMEDDLHPDEDYLEQGSRNGTSPCPKGFDMVERTSWFRENLRDFQHHWEDSIEGLGNCAHLGEIPPECISQVALYAPEANPHMSMMAADPMISIINYQLLGGTKYRALTDWFFGHPVEPVAFDPTFSDEFIEMIRHTQSEHAVFYEERRRSWVDALANRGGVELLL